jgi:glucose/arabinose dehydrogenase
MPAGFQDATVISGLNSATAMQFAPDGRLFVTEQRGTLRVIKNGVLLPTPFLTIPAGSIDPARERGLLGVAFDPDFATNQYIYVFYTATAPAVHNRVSRFRANGDVVDTTVPELVLLDFDNLSTAENHNGGAMHFGLDGKLYIAHGDNALGANAQTLGNLLGKIIRMNPVADPVAQIPTDNPFFGTATGKNRLIWALGLRNPFTFSIQPGTGLTYVNDVGQNAWEEIDDARAGRNFGWPTTEGSFNQTTYPQFTLPVYSYHHSNGTPTGCAITGGAFYNPTAASFPASYVGKYFFADYCSNWIYYIDPASPGTATPFAADVSLPVDLKVGPDGALYYLARGTNRVGRIQYTAVTSPQISQHPASVTVGLTGTATFSVSATGSAPLSYQWQRNNVDIPSATGASYTTPAAVLADNGGTYRCRVTNAAGSVTSNSATLTVLNNAQPTATIVTPAIGARFSGGTTLTFSGGGTDTEDGTIAAAGLTWQIDFHHATHVHPGMPATSGVTSGTFAIPSAGETAANVWYRVHLTVTDSAGLSTATFVDVLPNTATITLSTLPAGLTLTLDGQPFTTPLTVTSVVGMVRSIGVPASQGPSTAPYRFVSWSDGGAATHTILTPASSVTYTATLTNLLPAPGGLRIVR